jgi:hypothetical protein
VIKLSSENVRFGLKDPNVVKLWDSYNFISKLKGYCDFDDGTNVGASSPKV